MRDGQPDIIAVDGKTSRRCRDKARGRGPLHLVSAWAARQRLVLGREATDAKSDEITATPLLLERLELAGALVTSDARGTQTVIIENRLHWTLDVVFHDDLVRLRTAQGPETMAVFRHCAMNLVRATDDKHSFKVRRIKANLDTAYVAKLLTSAKAST